MNSWNTEQLVADDKRYLWHPFTNMGQWCAPDHEPIVLVEGHGALVRDSRGREYIDGNSSIWTNIHGHNHPQINAAIRAQLERVAHTSFLGTTNPPAIELGREIVKLFPEEKFGRVFYSDDGSTGIEAAMRIVSQYWKLKQSNRYVFISFREGYHGDTAGAASLGAAALFGGGMSEWRAPVEQVATIEELAGLPHPHRVAAVIIEPVIQGAAGMKIWPEGTLRAVRSWCDQTGALLIADEVMTGFGRTGKMFACEHEDVQPDLYVFGKGLSGGYLPLAVTLVSHQIFAPFWNTDRESVLYYGHSFTGNALGCAAALASLDVFKSERTLENLIPKIRLLAEGLDSMSLSTGAVARGIGMIAAVELPNGDLATRACLAMRRRGLLTRPIREVVVFMPPLCIKREELESALTILKRSIEEVLQTKTDEPIGRLSAALSHGKQQPA
ncbi:MAG TPA: adenosylmethionine--8-amino-7-oxononanoate transaminase [Chthoniobacterales bacterium]